MSVEDKVCITVLDELHVEKATMRVLLITRVDLLGDFFKTLVVHSRTYC